MNDGVVEALAGLCREFDGLLPVVRCVPGAEVIEVQRVLEGLSRKVLAAQAELDAAAADSGVCAEHGYGTVRSLLLEAHRLLPREVTAREARREQLATRRRLAGEVLAPRLPETARALGEGAVGAAHVETITQVMRGVSATLDPDTCAVVEEQVVGFARQYGPRETQVLAAELVARLDPDGPEPTEADTAPRPDNTLYLGTSRRGRLTLRGEFDTTGAAALRGVIDALAEPAPPVEGVRDERCLAARQGDALVEAANQVLGFGELPDCGGARPQITITVSLDDLERRVRGGMLDHGTRLHPETARMIACDAGVVPVVLRGATTPLNLGRSRRTLNSALRRALVVRSGGCCEMPGCTTPASFCDGHPVFTPPALIDPERRPRPSRGP